ncbi:MAG: peptidase M48 [Nitrospirae bacterium GWC1_57_7]|jgi:STE24 endopeptidase|nr:MAG: peptidase M48 [Nitrospirae bacterium GWC1_57_7]HAR46792.1 peptidase M48 [Nitrospiraceae bacterium]
MMIALLCLYLAVLAARFWLRYLNLSHLRSKGGIVPPEFAGAVDAERLRRITAYTADTSRLGLLESAVSGILVMLVLFTGLLGVYDQWVASLTDSFVLQGTLFFLLFLLAETIIGIPFSLYLQFGIEARHGFNTMTPALWLTDLIKSLAISSVLGGAVLLASFSLVQTSPDWWWLWVWAFLLSFGIFVMYLSPVVIEPLFFRFEPLKEEGLEEQVRGLMERAGLMISRVFQVDASKRSKHSNAYFTGIGRVKRIVLFDTLLRQMTHEEILAVLAHEAGHWKKRHVLKQIVVSETLALIGLYSAFHLFRWDGLPGLAGLEVASFAAQSAIVLFLFNIALFPLTPLFSHLSRKNEGVADRFAVDLTGNPAALADALVKLSRENLANLHPHPVYAAFYYSHPPVVERIRQLKGAALPGS